jgi:hypothetical protein
MQAMHQIIETNKKYLESKGVYSPLLNETLKHYHDFIKKKCTLDLGTLLIKMEEAWSFGLTKFCEVSGTSLEDEDVQTLIRNVKEHKEKLKKFL